MRALYLRCLDWCYGVTSRDPEVRSYYRLAPFCLGDLFTYGFRFWWAKVRRPEDVRMKPSGLFLLCRSCKTLLLASHYVFGKSDVTYWRSYNGMICSVCGARDLQFAGWGDEQSLPGLSPVEPVGADGPADAPWAVASR